MSPDLASKPCSPAPESPPACWSTAARGASGPARRLLRILAFVVALEALVTRPAPAANPAGAPAVDVSGERERIAVLRFFGPRATMVRASVIQAVVDAGGVELPPVTALEAQLGAGTSLWAQAAEVARRWRLEAIVHGATRRSAGVYRVTVTVLAGDDGTELGHLTFSARSLPRLHAKIQAELWRRLHPLLDRARGRAPAPVAAPSPATSALSDAAASLDEAPAPDHEKNERQERDERDEPVPPPPRYVPPTTPRPSRRGHQTAAPPTALESGGCSLVDLDVGGGVLLRAFNYRGEQRGALRAYTLRRAPLGRVEGTLYPFARGCGLGAAFGLRASYERMAPVQSTLADREFTTNAFAYRAELVGRIRLGHWVLAPALGYYVRSYALEEPVVPRVKYQAVGGALDVQLRLSRLVVEIGAGARRMLDAGELRSPDWFPDLTATTYSGRLRLGGAMTDWLDIILGLYGEYSTFDFHIQETGSYPNGVAKGAHDAYLAGLLSLRLHLP